jgi:hypothetical protein
VQFTFPKELGGAKGFGIVGCKYWVQRRTTEENVNFHYGMHASARMCHAGLALKCIHPAAGSQDD